MKAFVVHTNGFILSVNQTSEGAIKALNTFVAQSKGWHVNVVHRPCEDGSMWSTYHWKWKNETLNQVQDEFYVIREKPLGD